MSNTKQARYTSNSPLSKEALAFLEENDRILKQKR